MKIALENKKLYIKAGLYYEYTGSLEISIKVYLIFIKTFFFSSIIGIRFLCCCYWLDLFKKRGIFFFRNNQIINQVNFESFLFIQKYHQYLGNFKTSLELYMKLITSSFNNHGLGKILINKIDFKTFINNNLSRIFFLENKKNLIGFNLKRSVRRMKRNKNKKEFCIWNRLMIHFIANYSIISKIKNFFCGFNIFEKNERPVLFENMLYLDSNFETMKNMIKLVISLNLIDLKLHLIRLKKNFFLKDKSKLFFLNPKNCHTFQIGSYDSYSSLNRNYKLRLYQILKFERNSRNLTAQKLILKTMYQYALVDKKNPRHYYLFAQIQQRLGLNKNALKSMFFFHSVKIEKKRVDFDQKYNLKLNFATEKFYEKKKINALLRISLIHILINFKLSLIVKNGKKFRKIKFIKGINKKFKFEKKKTKKNKDFFKILETNENLILFYKILIYKITKKKNIQKKFLIDKILEVLVSKNIFKKLNSIRLKSALIVIILKKKKYTKAYDLLRQQCFNEPYSILFWQLLSFVEKKIGLVVSKTLRFTLRILKKFPDSIPGIVFAGNLCSVFGSNGYALAEFFQAYRWKSNSPFLNLSISIQYLNGSVNRRTKLKGFALLLCLSFYLRYKILRFFIIKVILQENYFSPCLEKEGLYNSGRILLFLGIHTKAKINFASIFELNKTISMVKKFKRNRKKFIKFAVKKEAQFNSIFLDECNSFTSSLTNF